MDKITTRTTPSATTASIYDRFPLDGSSQFRLLILAPAMLDTAPLVGALAVHSIDEPPPYDALSYVWGPPIRDREISCDGELNLITETLDRALRRFRLPDRPRALWIDQICINQQDDEERSHQVQIMRHIYARAETVLAWLGPDTANQATTALKLVSDLAAVFARLGILTELIGEHIMPRTHFFPSDELLARLELPSRASSTWKDLNALLLNAYFLRVWVIQEVLLGSRVVLVWGATVIPWQRVQDAYRIGTVYWMSVPDTRSENCPSLLLTNLRHFVDGKESGWVELLHSTSHCNASDPRDYIYALLGVVEDAVSLRADYTLTMAEVFATSTKHIIRSTKSLGVLSYIWLENLDNLEQVPAWAPRWDRYSRPLEDRPRANMLGEWCQFAASGSSCAVPRGSDDELDTLKILTLEGYTLDSVLHVGGAYPFPITSMLDIWKTFAVDFELLTTCRPKMSCSANIKSFIWAITAGHTRAEDGYSSCASDPEHVEDFIATTLNEILSCWGKTHEGICLRDILKLGDFALDALPATYHGVDHCSISPNSRQWLKDAIKFFHASQPTAHVETIQDMLERVLHKYRREGVDRFKIQMELSVWGRRMFVTKNGHVGTAPRYIQEGDVICLLFGGKPLYVLRPLPGQDEYLFLGECYVYGMMDGEAIPTDEDRKDKPQWFRLR